MKEPASGNSTKDLDSENSEKTKTVKTVKRPRLKIVK